MINRILLLISVLSLTACSSTNTSPVAKISPVTELMSSHAFEELPTITEQKIFDLPQYERDKFLAFYNKELEQGVRPDKAIFRYLENRLDNFTFDGETLTAQESLERNEGNCISLAILTQAYASLAKVDTTFIEVGTMPVFRKNQDTILISNHFRTKLLAPKKTLEPDAFVILRAGTVVDYFPAQDSFFINNATYQDLVSKYYANKAVDALLSQQFNQSYSLLKKALQYRPYHPELINIAAILHRRNGQIKQANAIYQYALENQLTSQNLLSNYLVIARDQSDTSLISHLESLLDSNVSTPFDKIQLARRAVDKGQYKKAIKQLEEVISETPYIPEPYFELAKLYHTQGDRDKTVQFLAKAAEKSSDPEKRTLFQAKRDSITQR
ncbi:tetratricopeptide repeat protein [Pseudoalteromonas luteoviolacea]|uniref:Uncharacterized protein n=1 Tax=Pseudoalteromonas luteoviolacea S4054 TaxID=1129367 RepID=A0A0F6A9G4_9GAMM|nr:tetratricopeptide repeat protein [Pseudoalteromonas luteoviolacea]AOT08674.1 hypothetical protein S4054249_12785 [Pseudoalteromonas luteoviolacea]AOT13589.1 hypothetical protein S40542_12760 [Pseudoalteromonas luteoviolacea]AOT18502.1 hypothetical protein S4054_12760 [Pseudoalteromonas luteoviolacea]KKE82491.1 hypothetical protein N479_17955 [Pseudoalteromonas luteoviolacea S4054]KZN72028.1 hypothetical protein N481_16590 [Pseudoalteromonas luteoviolacea S4047-1]